MISEEDLEFLYSNEDVSKLLPKLATEVRRLKQVEEAAKELHVLINWWVSSRMAISPTIIQANQSLEQALRE